MGDAEYVAAFQQIVMPVAYEVSVVVFSTSNCLLPNMPSFHRPVFL